MREMPDRSTLPDLEQERRYNILRKAVWMIKEGEKMTTANVPAPSLLADSCVEKFLVRQEEGVPWWIKL